MRFLFVFLFFTQLVFAQENTDWYAFYNADSTLIGYKDAKGNVKIKPKFEAFMPSEIFKNVISVIEPKNGKWEQYYLNKKGEKFGKDSVYISDYEPANESDGKIKFRDYKTDKVGFFDFDGKVVIPALYDDADDFHGGLAVVLKDGKRWCWDNNSEDLENCEHVGWVDFKTFMINAENEILFEIPEQKDFSFTIDWSKFKINEEVDSEIYTSLTGSDGNIYSFYSPEKDFNKWFEKVFIEDFKTYKTVLPKYFYALVAVTDNDDPKSPTVWKNHAREEYIEKNQKEIDQIFSKIVSGEFKITSSWRDYLKNDLYYSKNILPKEDLQNNVVIEFLPRAKGDYTLKNAFQFTKIGSDFFITSAP